MVPSSTAVWYLQALLLCSPKTHARNSNHEIDIPRHSTRNIPLLCPLSFRPLLSSLWLSSGTALPGYRAHSSWHMTRCHTSGTKFNFPSVGQKCCCVQRLFSLAKLVDSSDVICCLNDMSYNSQPRHPHLRCSPIIRAGYARSYFIFSGYLLPTTPAYRLKQWTQEPAQHIQHLSPGGALQVALPRFPFCQSSSPLHFHIVF